LITYLRSEQAAGYHNTINLFIFYGILVAFYIFVALLFSLTTYTVTNTGTTRKIPTPLTESNNIDYRLIVNVGILFCVGIFAANLILILPHIDSETLLYMVCTFIGIVIIPYTFLFLSSKTSFAADKPLSAAGLILT
jgi:protein-S-isoprenylcysteine O-methyltransferase Ste14